jgi:putative chitinase
MRFTEFKILLEAKEAPVYVVGDSIAVGIKNASNADGIAVGGKNTKQVLDMVNDLINSKDLKGAVVILSSGASNATYERPNGERQSFTVGNVDAQLKALKRAGAKTFLVGTGSKKSKTFNNSLGTYFVNFEREKVNDQLSAAASANGATFLGPLENFDPGLNSGNGDGIHPYGGYLSIYQAATRGVTAAPADTKQKSTGGQGGKPGVAKVPLTSITVPTMDKGPDVADTQKVLKALGYGELLGPFGEGGVDGVIGKYTRNTIRTFQQDTGIKPITGMPDTKTIAKLNELLNSKFKGKITKSTSADVKLSHASAVKQGGTSGAGGKPIAAFNGKIAPGALGDTEARTLLTKEATQQGIKGKELAAFLAQCSHESGGFRHLSEIWGPSAAQRTYDGRMGNDKPGDGYRYRGRGYIQLTGKDNYTAASRGIGLDLVKNPDQVATPEIGAKTSVWFWKTNVQPAISDWDDVSAITRVVNGGYNGLDDRNMRYAAFKQAMNVA